MVFLVLLNPTKLTINMKCLWFFSVGYDQGGFGGQPGAMNQFGGQQFPGQQFPGQQYLNDPMANMAMQYGQQLAGQGQDIVQKKVGHFNVVDFGDMNNSSDYYIGSIT